MLKNCRLIKRKLIKLSSIQKCSYGFEQDKTIVDLVSKNQEVRYIKSISNFGFRLNNGIFTIGPIAIFNEILLSWNIKFVEEINPHSLSLFRMFVPKFEILIIGAGDNLKNLHPDLIPYLSSNRIAYEIQNTKDAAKLYNMMVIDRRNVAAVLYPPQNIGLENKPSLDDLENFQKLMEAKSRNDLLNLNMTGQIFSKYYDTYRVHLQEQYISKEELKKKIFDQNEAARKKQLTFSEIISDEVKTIKEEEQLLLRDEKIKKKSVFESDESDSSKDPNKKLIE